MSPTNPLTKMIAIVGLAIIAILFTDLPWSLTRKLILPVVLTFIVACVMNITWMIVEAPQPFVAYVALFAGFFLTVYWSVFLIERMHRISYVEELRSSF